MKAFSKEEIITTYKVLSELEKTLDEVKSNNFGGRRTSYDEFGWHVVLGTYNTITAVKNIIANKIAYDQTH